MHMPRLSSLSDTAGLRSQQLYFSTFLTWSSPTCSWSSHDFSSEAMVPWSGSSLIYHCVNVAIFTSLRSQHLPGYLAQGKLHMNECNKNGNKGGMWGVWIEVSIVNHWVPKTSCWMPSNVNSTYLFSELHRNKKLFWKLSHIVFGLPWLRHAATKPTFSCTVPELPVPSTSNMKGSFHFLFWLSISAAFSLKYFHFWLLRMFGSHLQNKGLG